MNRISIAAFGDLVERRQAARRMAESMDAPPGNCRKHYHSTTFVEAVHVHSGAVHDEQPKQLPDQPLFAFIDGRIDHLPQAVLASLPMEYRDVTKDPLGACLYGYQSTGCDFADKLSGEFTLFIEDGRNQKLVVITDRCGLRPAYFGRVGDVLLLSTDPKCVREGLGDQRIDPSAVVEWFSFGYLLGEKTLFEGVRVIPPGSVLEFHRDRCEPNIRRHSRIRYVANRSRSAGDTTSELVSVFRSSVNQALSARQRYAISLSGGLDSRAVAAALDSESWTKSKLFTFGVKNCSETRIARRVARSLRQPLSEVEITSEMILREARRTIRESSGLDYMGVSYIIPVHEAIAAEADVLIDGFGLDLTLGGSHLSPEILHAREDEIGKLVYNRIRRLPERDVVLFFHKSLHDQALKHPPQAFAHAFADCWQPIPANQCDCFLIMNHMRRFTAMGHVLIRAAMENACPTMNDDFLDLVCTIPPDQRYNHRAYRRFMIRLSRDLSRIPYNKTMIAPYFPVILWKPARIIQYATSVATREAGRVLRLRETRARRRSYVDFGGWLETDPKWRAYFSDLLLGDDARVLSYINRDVVQELLCAHNTRWSISGGTAIAMKLMYLASFELLLREVVS